MPEYKLKGRLQTSEIGLYKLHGQRRKPTTDTSCKMRFQIQALDTWQILYFFLSFVAPWEDFEDLFFHHLSPAVLEVVEMAKVRVQTGRFRNDFSKF